ncbi:hypothetical protein J6590_067892 [Homalodisca vitripennis]|nr:hypothetical protein J6590_067892 [Homalodisca vitripennis]
MSKEDHVGSVMVAECLNRRGHERLQLARRIEWTGPCDVATQNVCRSAARLARCEYNREQVWQRRVAQPSLAAPRSRAK